MLSLSYISASEVTAWKDLFLSDLFSILSAKVTGNRFCNEKVWFGGKNCVSVDWNSYSVAVWSVFLSLSWFSYYLLCRHDIGIPWCDLCFAGEISTRVWYVASMIVCFSSSLQLWLLVLLYQFLLKFGVRYIQQTFKLRSFVYRFWFIIIFKTMFQEGCVIISFESLPDSLNKYSQQPSSICVSTTIFCFRPALNLKEKLCDNCYNCIVSEYC